jgi:hypothetical protein
VRFVRRFINRTVGIISAFQFSVAVWAWNTALAGFVTFAFENEKTPLWHCLSGYYC